MNFTPTDSVSDNPRAFATATGFLFQGVGFVFAFGGCCLWSVSDFLQPEMAVPVGSLREYLSAAGVLQIAEMSAVVLSFVCGLGLIATGLGMQGEQSGSGRWALAVAGLLSLTWLTCFAVLLFAGGTWWRVLCAAILAGVCIILFLLAGNSARVLRSYPPPEEHSVVTDEFLESLRKRPPE